MPIPIDAKKDNVLEINEIEKKYKELLILQDTILGNINALEDSLGSAEKIVKRYKFEEHTIRSYSRTILAYGKNSTSDWKSKKNL
jgi:hypothetical protein